MLPSGSGSCRLAAISGWPATTWTEFGAHLPSDSQEPRAVHAEPLTDDQLRAMIAARLSLDEFRVKSGRVKGEAARATGGHTITIDNPILDQLELILGYRLGYGFDHLGPEAD